MSSYETYSEEILIEPNVFEIIERLLIENQKLSDELEALKIRSEHVIRNKG